MHNVYYVSVVCARVRVRVRVQACMHASSVVLESTHQTLPPWAAPKDVPPTSQAHLATLHLGAAVGGVRRDSRQTNRQAHTHMYVVLFLFVFLCQLPKGSQWKSRRRKRLEASDVLGLSPRQPLRDSETQVLEEESTSGTVNSRDPVLDGLPCTQTALSGSSG